jgi:hypothetical protein
MRDVESQPAGLLNTLRFSLFFAGRRLRRPEVGQPARGERPPGYFEQLRAEQFQLLTRYNVTQKSGEVWDTLTGDVYIVSHGALSCVLASYGPANILWLDDHADDSDFEEFLQREGLTQLLLPARAQDLVTLLCATKLNYLGDPRPIQASTDIPPMPQDDKEATASAGHPKASQSMANKERLLSDLAPQIQAPQVVAAGNGGFEVRFWVWTRILGRLVNLRCTFGADGSFRLTGQVLANLIGRAVVPR